jgi:hypothetical protein
MAALQVEKPPAAEPVTLAEAKQHCRVTITDDDDLISLYIQAALEDVEAFLARSLVNKGYRAVARFVPLFHGHGVFAAGLSAVLLLAAALLDHTLELFPDDQALLFAAG